MNLSNFEDHIPSVIFNRGQDYFQYGNVGDLQKLSSGEWIADVEGNYDNYNVEIAIDKKGEIKHFACNCPYDGEICKHVVAVLLTLRDKEIKLQPNEKQTPEWESIIYNTPKKELHNFLLDFAKKNSTFRNELLIKLSPIEKTENTAKYQLLISQLIENAAGRHGYIEYRDTYALMHSIHNLLKKAEENITKGNFYEAYSIISAVAPECIDAIEGMDDSNGQCGGAINEAFSLANKIMRHKNIDSELSSKIFDWLYQQASNPDYSNYGCADELEPLFFQWATGTKRLAVAYGFIEKQLALVQDGNSWSDDYQKTKYLKYKIGLLKSEGKEDEASKIIDENIQINDFREIRIQEALKANDHNSAIKLIQTGISIAAKNDSPGIVHNLKNQLLDIYKQTNDIKNLQRLSLELFLENTSTIEYYRTYKLTFNEGDWPERCNLVIKKLIVKANAGHWKPAFRSDLASVFIEEAMWNKLFNEVKNSNSISTVEQYLKYLKPHFSSEFLPLYHNSILKYAESTGRNVYVTLAGYLKNMSKLEGGFNEAEKLRDELLEKYKNRPAMKDEFKTLNW